MPDSKLSQLEVKTVPADEDLVLITDVTLGKSKAVTIASILARVASLYSQATTTVLGLVRRGVQDDVDTGTDDEKYVTPKLLKDGLNTKLNTRSFGTAAAVDTGTGNTQVPTNSNLARERRVRRMFNAVMYR